jgi:6-phosphogluconolactonase
MKLNKLSQLILVSIIGLAVASFLTACELVTIDLVFVGATGVSSASSGQIYAFETDAESGALRTGPSPVSTGGADPVAMAVTANYYHMYVANAGNNSIVHFAISDLGILSAKDTATLANTPVALATSSSNTYLFAVSGTASATLTEYPISVSTGTMGTPSSTSLTVPGYGSDVIVPTGVVVLADGNAVYVTAYDKSAYNPGGSTTSNANPGWLFGFTIGSNGALTPLAGSPYEAGVKPSAIATDPTSRFIYVTDFASNELIGYGVFANDTLQFMVNGPFKTGNEPTGVAVDPRGIYIYVANSLDDTVSAYSITLATGTPSTVVNATSSAGNSTDTDPVSIIVDPSLGRFVYTANYLGNSVSGFLLNPNTGALSTLQAVPYPTGQNPVALVAVPHGNHATQAVTQ